MKAKIVFENGRTAEIELTPDQVKAVESNPLIEKRKYAILSWDTGFMVEPNIYRDNPLHTFRAKEHAQLLADRFNLEMEMFRWASEMNEGWVPDWVDRFTSKYGIVQYSMSESLDITQRSNVNDFLFGLAFKSEEIAEQAKEIFGERILSIYGKQF